MSAVVRMRPLSLRFEDAGLEASFAGERIACEFRGRLEAKGIGAIEMYFIGSGGDADAGQVDEPLAGTAASAVP